MPKKSTSKQGTPAVAPPRGRVVNGALAKRAKAAAEGKRARLEAEARALLALIARRKAEIAEAFFDIGEALARLRAKEMLGALGRRSFAELCERDAGISATTGQRLVEVTLAMTREQAIAMGQKKAMAMVGLAEATPEGDTAAGLYRKKAIALPGGKTISPRVASANELEAAAARVRQARGKARRGRTTTPDERARAAKLEARLRELGLDRARVTAVATKPGQGADVRIELVAIDELDLLKRALGR
jgi:hypothetical protein